MIALFTALGGALAALTVLPMVRLVEGPSLPDRMVALDVMGTLIISSMLAFGLGYEEAVYIDVAIVYAILSYITTLYIAKYAEGAI